MTRIFVALLVSAAATVVLFIGAGMADGACHCMKSMFTLFPYGSFVYVVPLRQLRNDAFQFGRSWLTVGAASISALCSGCNACQRHALEIRGSAASHCVACRGRVVGSDRLLSIATNLFTLARANVVGRERRERERLAHPLRQVVPTSWSVPTCRD
jgi:hypothetical protein